MRKSLFVLLASALLLGLSSCDRTPKTVSLTVTVADGEVVSPVGLPESYKVTVTNTSTLLPVEVQTENGVAVFPTLVPGVYDVAVSATVVDGGATYIFSAAQAGVSVIEDTPLSLLVNVAKSSALIFKEIYYSGAPGENYYFRDQFYEIYNQSDETVYADGLCICATEYANYDWTVFYEWDIENSSDYVFATVIWQVPGTGTQYPIKPGESFVIAQWATDHRKEEYSKGLSTVNLLGAEFEAVTKEETLWNGFVITDNPALNMTKVVNSTGYNTPQWLTPVSGATYVIFNPSTPLLNENFVGATNASVNAREIKISDVLDAVQTGEDETRISTLGLPTVLDAGFQFLGGNYTGKSIARKKTGETEDGRPIFMDTNNTTNDFEICETPQVRRYSVGVPSWNTWNK